MYRNRDILEENATLITKSIGYDREQFSKIYEIIFQYLTDNRDIVIGSKIAVEAIVLGKIDIAAVIHMGQELTIYGSSVDHHAKEMITRIYRETSEETAYARPNDNTNSVEIYFKTRKMASIIQVPKYFGNDLVKLMRPIEATWDNGKISIISPEILLIDIYRNLVLPEYYDKRDDLHEQEKKLYAHFIKDNDSGKVAQINGGAENLNYNSNFIVDFKRELLDALYDSATGTFVVGQQAIKKDQSLLMMHVVSMIEPDQINGVIEKAEKSIYSKNPDYRKYKAFIDFVTFDMSIPIDYRLQRYRIRMTVSETPDGPRRNFQLIDIFNALQYDVLLNHPYTWMRFMFVDIWSIQLVFRTGNISNENAKSAIGKFIYWIKQAHLMIDQYAEKYDNPESYVGLYFSDKTARALNKSGKKISSFYPALAQVAKK